MTTTVVTLVLLLAVMAVAAVALRTRGRADADTAWPYYARKPLSAAEQILYFRLLQALPHRIVLCQVALSRLLGVKKGNNFRAWQNRIDRMTADFVICSKDSAVLAVIDLDDATHHAENRRAADAKKDEALSAAGIRVVRWQARWIPDSAAIRSAIDQQPVPAPAAAQRSNTPEP